MKRVSLVLSRAWLVAACIAFAGCADNGSPTAPGSESSVAVSGTVTEVQDMVPSDGPATITVAIPEGGSERLVFDAIRRSGPPPTPREIELYDLVRRVEVGDQVRATGRRLSAGIALETLAIYVMRN